MFKQSLLSFLMIVFCLFLISCKKIAPDYLMEGKGTFLKQEISQTTDSIPLEYGKLVGVTENSKYYKLAHLWFEKPDKSIVVVTIDVSERFVYDKYFVIPRH